MPVKTRNMTRLLADAAMKNIIMIDFDDATREWRRNKQILPNGCFSYIIGNDLTNKNNKKSSQ